MSYLVLARRLRPQRFEDVVGQEHVTRTLANAITGDRLAHAYLFTGVRGVGKTSVARILAKALNCEEGPTPTPCNKCESCREVTAVSSVDVLEIDGASNTGVDDVRELRENVRYLPQSSRYKVYIIDEVHMLSTAAFNALLKTLEEPPAHVVFVFATTEPHKIPTTILSRCQRFDFRRITRADLQAGLSDICEKEGFSIDPSDLMLIAREAEGSMRDALSLLDQVVSFSGKEVPKGEVARALGVVDRTWISELATSVLEGQASRALAVVDRAFDHGYNLKELLKELINFTRHVAVARELDDPGELIDLPGEEVEPIKKLGDKVRPEKVQAVFSILARAEEYINRAQDSRSIIEMAVIKATHAEPALPVDEAIRRLESVEKRLASGETKAPTSKPISGSGSGGQDAGENKNATVPKPGTEQPSLFSYDAMLDAARKEGNALLEFLLESATFEGMSDSTLILSLPKDSTEYGQLTRSGVRASIESMASKLRGEKVKLKIVDNNGRKQKVTGSETDEQKALKEEAREHPLVKGAQSVLEAKIMDIRPKNKNNHANGRKN